MAEATHEKRTPVAHFFSFLEHYRAYVWVVILYAAAVGLLALVTPITVQALVNTAAFGTVLQPIVALVILLFAGLVLASVFKVLKAWTAEVLQRRLFVDVVSKLAYRLPLADLRGPRQLGSGHLVHRYYDLFSIQKGASYLLLGGIDAALAGFVGLIVLGFYHPVLLAFDAILVIALLFIFFVLGRGGVRTSVAESTAKYAIGDMLSEIARPGYALRDAGGTHYARSQLDELAQDYLRARASHFRVVLRQYVGALVTQAVASASLLGLGGFLVISRELTLGQLVAAELIVTIVVATLSELGKHLETYYDLVTSVYKLDGLLDVPIEPDDSHDEEESLPPGPVRLVIRDLHMNVAGRQLLNGANLTLERGDRVRLTGPAESGKTSLLELLFGMRDADRGRIMVDGIDTRELSHDALRERIALLRGPEIFPGTVLDNVRLGRRDISAGRVRALLDDLGLSEEIARLPQGIDTPLGPSGYALSDSMAFRLTVARAMARSPGLVALDADLTAIDLKSLKRVLAALTSKDAPWTVLIVSEHPEIDLACSRHVELSDGLLTEGVSDHAAE